LTFKGWESYSEFKLKRRRNFKFFTDNFENFEYLKTMMLLLSSVVFESQIRGAWRLADAGADADARADAYAKPRAGSGVQSYREE
jgi:hypothetical protein